MLHHRFAVLLPLVGVFSLSVALAEDTSAIPDGSAAHEHAIPAKLPPLKPEDCIKLDSSAPRTVLLNVMAAYGDVNYGMNFNGFAKGNARYVIPKDWTVKITFLNRSPVPHSAIVVERPTLKKLQMGDPYFKGASTPNPVQGTTGPAVTFQFVPNEAGDFALACGFPSHALGGHWIEFEVSETATAPSWTAGKAEPYTAK